MEDYLYERGMFGTHKVKITLQKDTHKAVVFGELGGNVGGASILSSIASSLDDGEMEFRVTEDNKKYLDFEEGAVDGKVFYADYIRLYDGDSMIKEYVGEDVRQNPMSSLVVGIEIVEYTPEQY